MVKLMYINKTYMEDWEFINEFESEEDALAEIKRFTKECGYTIPYWRVTSHEDYKWYDIGSYTQFYKIVTNVTKLQNKKS